MKKSIGFVTSAVLVMSLLAACSNNSGSGSASSTAGGSSSQLPSTASKEQTVTIKYVAPGTEPKSAKEILDAVNKKLLADGVNVQIQEQWIDWAAWEQKLNLMLSTNEDFDMFQVMNDLVSLSNYIGRGAVQDIGKQLDQYGPNLKKVIPADVFNAVKKDGKTYGIPSYWYESSQDGGFTTNDYLFKKYNIHSDFKTPQELLDASEKLYNAASNPKPIFPTNFSGTSTDVLNRTFDSFPFDVRDSVAMITKDGKVKSWLESDEFKQEAAFWRQAYQKKLLNPDILTMKTDQAQKAVDAVNWPFMNGTYGGGTTKLQQAMPDAKKEDLSYRRFNPEKGYYRFVNAKNVNVVAANSKHPEAVVKFLNWLYAGQDNYDLFLYGIEGKTYKKVGDKGVEAILDPDTKQGLMLNPDWMIGNLSYVRTNVTSLPSALTIYQKVPDAKSFISSGFFFDAAPVKTELANVKSVITSDIIPIYSGVVDYDKSFKQAFEKLKAAGLDKVLAEYQKQLDAYTASMK